MDSQAWAQDLRFKIEAGLPIKIFGRTYHLDRNEDDDGNGGCAWCQDNLPNGRSCPRGPFDKHPLKGSKFQAEFGIHAENMDWRVGQCPAEAPCWSEGEVAKAELKVREMFASKRVDELKALLAEAEGQLEELRGGE